MTATRAPEATAREPLRQPLSRERIVAAAVDFVDSKCLSELSMRRLGSELGVEAMSLYRYFPSKSALLDAVTCRVLGELRLPEDDVTDWAGAVRAYAHSFRRLALEHPNLLSLLAMAGEENETLRDIETRMLDLWRASGVSDHDARRSHRAVQGYITGSSLRDRCSTSDDEFAFGLEALVRGLRAELSLP